jgi:NADPH-dependent glutamate synthase beta subunit-like oxidoreductase
MDHIRLQLSPCRFVCPIGQNCQAYIQQILRGQGDRALATILETNPLPGILGRICHHPCQKACALLGVDQAPVAIRDLKRFLAESFPRPAPPAIPCTRPEIVGIVGSGPSGLMAAWELRRRGYKVVVLEQDTTPGGKLTRAIPEFRLPLKAAMADIEWIERWGIEFRLGCRVGVDLDFNELRSRYDAVLLAAGGGQPIRLNIDGEDSSNVRAALPFLESVKAGQMPVLGNAVVVIGGGNLAVDAALTAKRMGATSVRIVCLEKQGEMPAFDDALQEATAEDIMIEYGWGPNSFSVKEGAATAVKCHLCLCVWQDQCFAPSFDCSIYKDFAADSFLVAIGDQPDRAFLQSVNLYSDFEKNRLADPDTLETQLAGVFAAGDLLSGPGSVVDAMAAGRRAAITIDRHLKGDDKKYGRNYAGPFITDFDMHTQAAYPGPQQRCAKVPPAKRIGKQEIELGLDAGQALEESKRCLSCGVPVGYNDSCWACLPCEVACPEQALRVTVPYLVK